MLSSEYATYLSGRCVEIKMLPLSFSEFLTFHDFEIRETKKFSLVKADEILLWLELHNDISGWVVLDDLDLHNSEIEKHQIKTDQTAGLSVEEIKNAERILLGK